MPNVRGTIDNKLFLEWVRQIDSTLPDLKYKQNSNMVVIILVANTGKISTAGLRHPALRRTRTILFKVSPRNDATFIQTLCCYLYRISDKRPAITAQYWSKCCQSQHYPLLTHHSHLNPPYLGEHIKPSAPVAIRTSVAIFVIQLFTYG